MANVLHFWPIQAQIATLLHTSSRAPLDLLQSASRPPPKLPQTSSRPPPHLLQSSSRTPPDLLQSSSKISTEPPQLSHYPAPGRYSGAQLIKTFVFASMFCIFGQLAGKLPESCRARISGAQSTVLSSIAKETRAYRELARRSPKKLHAVKTKK